MKLFFAWIKPNEPFSAQHHCREDITIFKCVIAQRETEVAVARILTNSAVTPELGPMPHAVIAFDDGEVVRVLFRGRVASIPVVTSDGFVEWELNAESHQAYEQMMALAQQLDQESGLFEKGFYDNPSLADRLESRQDVMCWDRTNGQLILSNIFKGRVHKTIEDSVFQGSLKVNLGSTPVNAVDVSVDVRWTQRFDGHFNLAPLIARAFPDKIMNTLTGNALIKQWPRVGQAIGGAIARGKGGYEVVKSSLNRLGQASLFGLKQSTDPLYVAENKQPPRLRSFKYAWFKGSLWIRWKYRQLCSERVSFRVESRYPSVGGSVRSVRLRLPSAEPYLETSSAVTVLRTDRGRQLLNYARAVAAAHLAGTSRQLEVTFCVPYFEFFDVTLDTSVTLIHKDVPGGRMTGKVTHYSLISSPDQWCVWVTIAAPLWHGENAKNAPKTAILDSLDEGYVVDYARATEGEEWALRRVVDDQNDEDFLPVDPALFTLYDLVKDVQIGGDATSQEAALRAAQFPMKQNFRDSLMKDSFFIHVDFRDLSSKPVCAMQWECPQSFLWPEISALLQA